MVGAAPVQPDEHVALGRPGRYAGADPHRATAVGTNQVHVPVTIEVAMGQPGSRNEGMELLKATETILAKGDAWNDPVKQEELTLEWMNWYYDQHMSTGVLEGLNVTDLYRSDYIESWTNRQPGVPWLLWDPEYVTLR